MTMTWYVCMVAVVVAPAAVAVSVHNDIDSNDNDQNDKLVNHEQTSCAKMCLAGKS